MIRKDNEGKYFQQFNEEVQSILKGHQTLISKICDIEKFIDDIKPKNNYLCVVADLYIDKNFRKL
jgi:hypothetical protein